MSAEEPTFFDAADDCRRHNIKLGLSPDSCRTFYDEQGRQKYWSFESTCIMHDDGDHEVRPFQRACRRVIEDRFAHMRRRPYNDALAFSGVPFRENIFGYETVLLLDMHRNGQVWELELAGIAEGVAYHC